MSQPHQAEKSIFLRAIEFPSAPERAAYLDQACAGDRQLRAGIEELFRADARSGDLLDAPSAMTLGSGAFAAWPTADTPIVSESPGAVIGPYKLLEEIGEGGFGVVYMAEQATPVRRKVALKILKPGMDTRQVVARFEAERQALAIMDHPHIAKVYDGGATLSGRPYFVMELVKGVPVTEFCDQNHLSPRERLELFIPVCQAVQHAHQKGIIHRDLKPSNILVSRHDTTPVVKIIDFGVAKALGQELTEKTLFTSIAQMIGTPMYMSPEQAGMSDLDVDTRSDIYSLGVLLYELLTGTTPLETERFQSAGHDEIRRIIREEEPTKPSMKLITAEGLPVLAANRGTEPAKLTRFVRGELDWIVMKTLEKDRNRRYETASALATDVQRYLGDEPVQACPPSNWYRFRKFARRNKSALATVSVMGLAVLMALATLTVSTLVIGHQQRLTANALQNETRAKDDLRSEAYFQRITLAHHDLSADNLAGALRRLSDCPTDLRGWEWHYLMRLCKVDPLIIRSKSDLNGVAFSPDGNQLASAGGDGIVSIVSSRTGKAIRAFPAHTGAVQSVVFHRDGRHLASRGADKAVKVWNLTATDQPVFTEPCDQTGNCVCSLAFSPDGRLLAWGDGGEGVVKVWDWTNRRLLRSLPGHAFNTIPLAFGGDGRLATATGNVHHHDGLKVWNPETGALLCAIDHDTRVSALAFTSDGKWLASASFRGPVILWDSTTGTRAREFDLHTGNVESVAISPDGKYLASGGEDKTVRHWDAVTGREILGLHGHTDKCWCVAFSPDPAGWRLVSASSDETIRIWDATPLQGDEHQEKQNFSDYGDEIRTVAYSPDGRRIAWAGDSWRVQVWDAQTGQVSVEFDGHKAAGKVPVFSLVWHPGSQLIASSGLDTVRVWDAQTGRTKFDLEPARGLRYQAVAYSPPDGRYLITAEADGAVRVWDGETGEKIGMLDIHSKKPSGLAFSKGGEYLASASRDGTVKIWDAKRLDRNRLDEQQEARHVIRTRVAGPGLNIAFSPDGLRLATGGEENTVKIWDVHNGEELHALRGHSGDVYALAFSPNEDGRWLASGGEDSSVKVWNSHTGKLIRSLRGHFGLVSSLAFSPDGAWLVSGSRDKTVKIWDMTLLQEAPDR